MTKQGKYDFLRDHQISNFRLFVSLVSLVTLVSLVNQKDQINQRNQIEQCNLQYYLVLFLRSRFNNSKAIKPIPIQMAESATLKAGQWVEDR